MTMVRLAVAILVTLGSSQALTAQTGSVSGLVKGPEGQPIAGVQVSIRAIQLRTLTDENGGFVFREVPVGEHELLVSGLGYAAKRITIKAEPGQASQVLVTLGDRPDNPLLGIMSQPLTGLRVYANSERKGLTPSELVLTPGTYRIRFVNPDSGRDVCALTVTLELGDRRCVKCTTTTGQTVGC